MRRVLIIVGILLIPLIPIVLVISGVLKTNPTTVAPVTITIWGTQDEKSAFTSLFEQYNLTRPYATIDYQQVPAEGYYDRLVSAWAQGTGPDLYFVPSIWVGQMTQFAEPMPAQLGVPIVRTGTGLLRTGTEVVAQQQPAPSIASLREQFVDVVTDDVVIENQIWGLPMAMDTIVVYHNKDLLNNAKIFEPARTWGELVNHVDVSGLTIVDEQGTIVQSGVALGTIDNVPNAVDLLGLLLLQNGWPSIQANQDRVTFNEAAQSALDFFLSFSSTRKVTYSWNSTQPNARDAFLAGKVAYFFGTLEDRATIEGSGLNWGVSSMLHLSTEGDRDGQTSQTRFIDSAKYHVLMVSKASQVQGRSQQAWNLLYFLSRRENVPQYLDATGKLSAFRSILGSQRENVELGVYANQLLTAKSWYHGRGGQQAEGYLAAMVRSLNAGQTTIQEALKLVGEQLTSTL